MEKMFRGSIARVFACFAAVLMAVMVLCTGCSSANADEGGKNRSVNEEETGNEVRDDIVIAMASEAPTLHPFDHKSVTAGYFNSLTYNCLFMLNIDTLEPEPDLCQTYTQIDDSTWEFTIYDDIYFHDGSHMTADDVVASMEWAKTFATTSDYTSFWISVEKTGDYTVKITTDGPYALTLQNLASVKIVPAALIESGHDFGTDPIGSGPYKFVSQTLGEKVVFVKNEDYFDEEHMPHITNMTWRIIPEGSSRTIALEAGEVDVIIEVESNDTARLEENSGISVYKADGTRLNFIAMNSEKAPFDNKDFRKAINAAIDRDAVVTVACNGEGVAAISQAPSVFEGATEAGAEGYDIEKAKEYLENSGIDTESLVIPCIVSNDTDRRAAEVIQACLVEIGVSIEIENMDYATQLTAVMSGDYEMSLNGYTSSNMYRYLCGLFHSSAIDAANLSRINDEYVDSLIDLGKTQIDVNERGATFEKVIKYLNEWTPFVSLYQTSVVRAASSELQGFKVSASGNMQFADVYWAAE